MSEENFDDLFDENGEPTGEAAQAPKALRDWAKAQAKRAKDLEAENATLKSEKRTTDLKQFVKDKGLDEKAVGLIGDQDPEKWFNEYGELFAKSEGGPGGENNDPGDGSSQPSGQPALTPEQIAQMQQTQNVQPAPYQPSQSGETKSKLETIFNSNLSETEIDAQLREMGAMI